MGNSERFNKEGELKIIPFISFPEWANDKLYFEKLIEGESEAVAIFNNYRELFFLEYKHPEITESAIAVQDNWGNVQFVLKRGKLSIQHLKCANALIVRRF